MRRGSPFPVTPLQRLLRDAVDRRTHGRRPQADIRAGFQGWPERQRCGVLLTLPALTSGRHRFDPVNDRCSAP